MLFKKMTQVRETSGQLLFAVSYCAFDPETERRFDNTFLYFRVLDPMPDYIQVTTYDPPPPKVTVPPQDEVTPEMEDDLGITE